MSKRIHFASVLLLILGLSTAAMGQTDHKAAYGVLIDNTGSMRSQFELVNRLGRGIVERLPQGAIVGLFSFKTQGSGRSAIALISEDVEWSANKGVLFGAIDEMYVLGGQTRLRDSINAIAEQLNKRVSSDKDAFAAKIIFLITDGEDRSSKIGDKELIKILQDSHVKVNAIGLVKELSEAHRERALSFLEKLTKETGGRVVFSKSNYNAEALLNDLFAK